MPMFRYAAKERTGRPVNGVTEAVDQKALMDVLRNRELVIISIKEEKKKDKMSLMAKFGGEKIKLAELVLFSRQMATMIDSGIPLMQALEILSEQIENKSFKAIVLEVKKDVGAGCGFHEALAKHPRAFSQLFVNMVKAGESSGALDAIMERLASYLEKTDSLTRKVRTAMIYPGVVTSMALVITLVMMIKVVPVFKGIFKDFGGKLPLPTQVLITISDFLVAGGAILFIISIRDLLSFGKGKSAPEEALGVVPLAVPLIVGPAVLTTSLIVLSTYGFYPTVFSLVLNICLCGVILSCSEILSKILGQGVSRTLSKISSLLLGAIGVMMVRRGLQAIIMSGFMRRT